MLSTGQQSPSSPRVQFDMSSMQQPGLKERFYRYFQEEESALQEMIAQLENKAVIGGERQGAIDHCLTSIARLSNEVMDASGCIPAYDQRTYSQAVKALSEKLQDARAKFAPKARFAFKTSLKNVSVNDATQLAAQQSPAVSTRPQADSSLNPSSISTASANTLVSSAKGEALSELSIFRVTKDYNEELNHGTGALRKPSFSQASMVQISNHTGLHIILPSSARNATSSGALTNLNCCIVDMSVPTANGSPFAGLSLKNIKMSLIVVGQVAGAAHITGVEDSIITVASRQVRIHECKNVDIYLQCASRPIIEDCSGVRFAPIADCYAVSSNRPQDNHWDQVDDFKWLKAEHSPNWSILPESERLTEDMWTKTVPGAPGMSPQDILKKMGVTS